MKKSFKSLALIVLFIISFFVINNSIKAKASCDSLTDSDARAACKSVESYCTTGEGAVKGCIYDDKDTEYTNVKGFQETTFTRGTIKVGDSPLVRGYTTLNEDNNVIFAGCYRYYKDNDNGDWPKGWYYIFRVRIPTSSGGCKTEATDIVPGYWDKWYWGYDGQNAANRNYATWLGWVGKLKTMSDCPNFFAYAGNPKGYTFDRNKFIFANHKSDLKNHTVFRAWDKGSYEYNYGCTLEDTDNFNRMIECYDKAIKEVNDLTCPKDLSNISAFQTKLNGLAKSCGPEGEVMYHIDLLNKNKETFKKKLNTAVETKMSSCQYSNCKLSDSAIQRVIEKVGTKGCAGETGSNYNQCVAGLKGILHSIGLSESEIKCILESQGIRDNAVDQLEDQIEDDQNQHIEDEQQEAQEIREDLYQHYEDAADITTPEFPSGEGGPKECSKVLGENLHKVVKTSITILQIVGAIIAIVKGMMVLIPPIVAKDADALKKAGKTLTYMAIILVIIFLFKPLLTFLGDMVGFDTSCLV